MNEQAPNVFGSFASLFVGLLPPSRFKNFLLRRLGYGVSSSASIGHVLLWRVVELVVSDGASVGFGTVIRNVRVQLADSAVIGQWNWISAAPPLVERGAPGVLEMGSHSALTSRHYVDATGGVQIGSFTTVAGVRSTFVSHGIDWRSSSQSWQRIALGEYCLIGSNSNFPPGSSVPDRSVVGMGATLPRDPGSAESLILAPRAAEVGRLTGGYFNRARGFVD